MKLVELSFVEIRHVVWNEQPEAQINLLYFNVSRCILHKGQLQIIGN
jgi:hypothetical protein